MAQKTTFTYGQAGYWAHQFEAYIQQKGLEEQYAQAMIKYHAGACDPYLAMSQAILAAQVNNPKDDTLFKISNNNVHEQLYYGSRRSAVQARLQCSLEVFKAALKNETFNVAGVPNELVTFRNNCADSFKVKSPSVFQRIADEWTSNDQNLLGRKLANKNKDYHFNAADRIKVDNDVAEVGEAMLYDYAIPLIPNAEGSIEPLTAKTPNIS